MLTTSEIADSQIAGLTWPTLAGWISKGIVTPVHVGRKGRGNSAQFSVMQAVGIAVAAELCRQPRGCQPAYVKEVVEAFSNVSEKWLKDLFSKGQCGFTGIDKYKKPQIGGWAPSQDFPHVAIIYSQVIKKFRE